MGVAWEVPYSTALEARIEALEAFFGTIGPGAKTWQSRFEDLEVAAGTNTAPPPGVTRSFYDRLAAVNVAAGFPS